MAHEALVASNPTPSSRNPLPLTTLPPATRAAPAPKAVRNQAPPVLTGASDSTQKAVAAALAKRGAVMYGTYWCPFCDLQRQEFGKDAWATVSMSFYST